MSVACAPIDPTEHLGLAGHLARRYLRHIPPGMEPDDVYQEARIGILIAAQRFDPARGTTFGTYAAHWVKARVLAAFKKHKCREKQFPILKTAGDNGEPIAFENTITDREEAPDHREQIESLLAKLPVRLRRVMELHFGLEDGVERTLEEVGAEIGVSAQRAHQLLAKTLKLMRQEAEGEESSVPARIKAEDGRRRIA